MWIQRRTLALIGVGCLLPLAVLYGRPVNAKVAPGVLRAKAIEIVDSRGQVRAQLNTSPDGEVIFRLRDANGAIRVKLGASEDGSGLLMLNEATQVGAHVLATRVRTAVAVQRGEEQAVLEP